MSDPSTSLASCFPVTQWTQVITVIQQGDQASAWTALEDFCQRYRPAIRNFFLRRGCSPEQAEDYTQAFFASRIVARWETRDGFLHVAQRAACGKFRSFLAHVLWRFLQDEWKKENSARAGGGARPLPLENAELLAAPGSLDEFGREFDRTFSLELIRKAAARSEHSRHLQAHLRGEMSQQQAARELGLSENAFKQAYHRFRERLARDLWDEVSQLVGPAEQDIRAEIAYLVSLFGDPRA